jgi:hypothetical protein
MDYMFLVSVTLGLFCSNKKRNEHPFHLLDLDKCQFHSNTGTAAVPQYPIYEYIESYFVYLINGVITIWLDRLLCDNA